MFDTTMITTILAKLNALAGGLFLLTAFALVATRQVLACLRIYIGQSVLLAFSAVLLGVLHGSVHLFIVAAITLAIKSILIPRLLRRTVGQDIYARREISQILNVPTSLLIAVAIAFFAYAVATPLLAVSPDPTKASTCPSAWRGFSLALIPSASGARLSPSSSAFWRWKTAPFSPAFRLLPAYLSSPNWRRRSMS